MSFCDHEDANKWLDTNKVSFENDSDLDEELNNAEPVVKSYLSDRYGSLFSSWDTPANTPNLVRTITAKLCASYRYAKKFSEESTYISSYATSLERQAMSLLKSLQAGNIELDDVTTTSNLELAQGDFWPNATTGDETNEDEDWYAPQKFTMKKEF